MADRLDNEPIAIIGLGCRFPGGAESPAALWDMLKNGRNAHVDFPADRLNIKGFYHPSPERADSFNFKKAHFLSSNVGAFDANFFGVAAKEADAIDPQQRILLEVSYEALENAGIPMDKAVGSKTCVFVGSFVKDYEQISMRDAMTTAPDCATGNSIAIMANRISYAFDFSGTSQTIDTGCSASLVSLHQAVNNLRNLQSDMALAGGAGLILTPSTIMPMTSLGFLSKDGKCYTFDHRANGYGRGEGIGMVVLKRLRDALRDNDTIRGVIRGTASNQDGRTPGITVPNPDAQLRCIRAAYENANLTVDNTPYVECHGTGTKVGDWRELKAISTAFCAERETPVLVGSIKPNVGHLEGAAGVAGVIRAVLILENGHIPPHINFEKWNPDIQHEEWKVDIALKGYNLPDGLRRASVNCFGFGGTNAHAVIDDGRSFLEHNRLGGQHNVQYSTEQEEDGEDGKDRSYLYVFSAQHKDGVMKSIDTVREYLAARFDAEPDANPQGARWNGLMRNLSYTLYSRRSLLDYRGWVIASDPSQLAEALLDFDETKLVRASASKPMNATFVFAGQGAQWAGMGQGLMSVRPFAESISSAHLFLQQEFGFDLLRHLHAAAGPTNIDKPEVAQPASTAIQVALTDLLRTVGITPKAVVGHSSGEIAAAYAAGIISRETALAVAYHRGHSAAEIKHATPPLKGRMLATGLSETEAKKVLNAHEVRTMAGKVVIACVNSPRGVTLSGDEAKIGAIQAKLTEMNMFNRLLKVDTAYHSHHMKTVAAGYLDRLRHLASADRPAEPVCPMFSSVYGEEVEAAQITPEYWVENLVSTVQFVKAFQAMLEGLEARGIKPNVYVELSPRSHLGTPVKDILDHAGVPDRSHEYVETLSRTRRCDEAMLETFARLWTAGHRIHLDAFLELPRGKPAPLKCLVDLAPYHWDHSKIYWAESHLSRRHRFRQFGSQDLIGAPTADSVMPHEPRWRGHFRLHENPWMAHHKIQGEMLYPAAGMIAMAIEGGKQVVLDSFQDKPCGMIDYEVRKFHILAPMIVPDNEDGLEHCLNAKRVGERTQGASTTWTYEFTIYSKPGRDPPFVENATGILKVRFSKPGSKVSSPQPRANGTAQALLTGPSADQHHKSPMSPFEFYEGLDVIGMQYGPLFRNITHIGPIDAQLHSLNCATSMTVPHTKTIMPEHFEFDHVIHPATLDTMFQSVFSLGSEPMVPWFLESVRVDARLPVVAGTQLAMQTCAAREGLAQVSADVRAFVSTQPETNGTHGRSSTSVDPCHAKFVEIKGLKAKSLASTAADTLRFLPNHRHLCSEMQWHQDVEHAAFDDLHAWLKLLGFKWPGLSIAHLGNEANIPKTVMSALVAQEPGDKGNAATMSRLGSYLMRARSDRDFNSIKKSLPTKHAALLHKMDNSDGQEHDLVIYEDNVSISATELQALVKPSGFLLVVESTDTIAKNASFPALEAVCKPVAHPELGTLWLWHKPMALRVPVNESVHILHGAAHGGGSSETGAAYLAARLERSGLKVEFLTPEDVDKSPAGLGHNAGATVISLLELEEESSGRLFDMSEAEFDRMKKLMDMSKNLLWLSRGAQMNASSPRSAIFQGWSRTVRSEDAQKNIVTVDVAQPQTVGNRDLAERVAGIFLNSFFGTSDETEYCISAEDIYIPRLMPLTGVNAVIEHGIERAVFFEPGRFSDNKRGHLKLAIATPGDLTSLFYTVDDTATRPLGADEVRIRVHAAGLLPIDAETLRNNTTEMTVGADVYGQILEAGLDAMHMLATSATTGDLIGSHVVALARGTIRQVMIVPAPMVRPRYLPLETFAKHKQLSWSPAVYTTAWRLVSAVGHFLSNWTGPACVPVNMLLVGASSTYGQAFLQLYRVLKAPTQMKIDLMTTAPNDEAEAVERALERTNGEGFDLVIDPTFQGTPVGTECFRGEGTLVELKKPARREKMDDRFGITVTTVNPLTFTERDFADAYDAISTGVSLDAMRPLEPSHIYSAAQVTEAFETLARAPDDAGTIRLDLRHDASLSDEVRIGYAPAKQETLKLKGDAAYLVAGGLGGIGRDIAVWLAEKGAKHIVIASRSGLPDRDQQSGGALAAACQALDTLIDDMGVKVYELKADISDRQALARQLTRLRDTGLPEIAGCIHAAGVLRDYTYRNMTHEAWTTAARVKTVGSWNLHELLPAALDFLIFLSSAAGVIGNRGQANYAAGNAFQDALARHRVSHGHGHTVSLDLGPVLGQGMVDQEMMDLLRGVGFFGIRRADFHFVLERAILGKKVVVPGDTDAAAERARFPAQVVLGVGTGGLIRQNKPADPFWAHTALFAHLNRLDVSASGSAASSSAAGGGIEALNLLDLKPKLKMAATLDDAVQVVLRPFVTAMVAVIPNLAAADVRADMTPTECGSDSMRGTYIDNWLRRTTGVSIGQGINALQIRTICETVARKGGFVEGR